MIRLYSRNVSAPSGRYWKDEFCFQCMKVKALYGVSTEWKGKRCKDLTVRLAYSFVHFVLAVWNSCWKIQLLPKQKGTSKAASPNELPSVWCFPAHHKLVSLKQIFHLRGLTYKIIHLLLIKNCCIISWISLIYTTKYVPFVQLRAHFCALSGLSTIEYIAELFINVRHPVSVFTFILQNLERRLSDTAYAPALFIRSHWFCKMPYL